jgi:hypothetical protein
MRNVTLSADERLIETARAKARRNSTTLNEEFRTWLRRYVGPDREARAQEYRHLMSSLSHVSAGRRFTRDEMNER